jgi:glycosyltransferase involved in cell wall biosynthesis
VNNRTICVRNLVDLNSFPVSSTPASLSTRRAWVVYAGLLAENRAVLEMVEAMGLLPDHLNARLELAGPAEPGLYDRMARLPGWQRVDFHGYMSRDGVAQLLDCARVGLELSYPEEHYLDAWPTKMFEYMAAGIPTVATDMPLYRELFGAPGCALLVDPKKPAAIAEAIHFLLTHDDEAQAMGRRGRALVEAHYQWSTEAQHLLACYGALGPTRGPDPKQPTIAPESRRGPWAGTGA